MYCLSNPSFLGLVKIGMTSKTVEARAAELYTTGVPTPFVIEASYPCSNVVIAEQHIHDMLDLFRESSSREFFRMKPENATAIMAAYFSEMAESDYFESSVADDVSESVAEDDAEPTNCVTTPASRPPSVRDVLEEKYVINLENKDKNNYCTSRELIDYIRGAHSCFSDWSDRKFGLEIRKLGLEKVSKKIDIRCVTTWVGITKKPTDGETAEEAEEIPTFREILEKKFVINISSTAENNYATARDIIEHIKTAGLHLSDKKIGIELGELGLTKIVKNISGKTIRVWVWY